MTLKAFIKNNVSALLRFINELSRPSHKTNLARLKQSGESLESFIIREVKPDELAILAGIHVKTWNETYPGVRNPPSVGLRESQWKNVFNKNDGSWFCLFMVNSKDQPVGFVYGLKYDRPDILPYEGQISKIYLLKSHIKLGLGKRLMLRAVEEFMKRNMNSMVLFASAENPACKFYETMNGKRIYDKSGQFHGAYGWNNLREKINTKE